MARVRLPSPRGLLGLPRKVMSGKRAIGERCGEAQLSGAVLGVLPTTETAWPDIVLVGLGVVEDETENLFIQLSWLSRSGSARLAARLTV